mmetsp:Transcript_36830/g.54100  ORF Transcript_36830/g.54100 Transcript_36830/m.54100 type:complete len:157 (-) Transcript_36830:295-765(-)|eukprot:CAMPEP_0195518810 /NCGR_PEP_ID=MMETSP0794_2-20130614/13707_1 /TAXON_ID=515487 /ORGANISM="Stephanopyxis turris, Strain CCMP 815" /LENGTH=156 /DNA_ID=CAMNT_0040647837 /DNA_START=76 /DNA_END=546 /DNA_ORIENTATION=+
MKASLTLCVITIASVLYGSAAYPEIEQFIEHRKMIDDASRKSSPQRQLNRSKINQRERNKFVEKQREGNRLRQEKVSQNREYWPDGYEQYWLDSEHEMEMYMKEHEQEGNMREMTETLTNLMKMQLLFHEEQHLRMDSEQEPSRDYGLRGSANSGL